MKRIVTASKKATKDQIKIDFMNYMINSNEAEIDGELIRDVYDRILDAVEQGLSFEQLEALAIDEGVSLVEALDMIEERYVR